MCAFVSCELVWPREALLTSREWALRGTLTGMDTEMLGQVRGLCKPLVTAFKLALERLLASVDSAMDSQRTRN